MRLNDRGTINSFKTTVKPHPTVDQKLQFFFTSSICIFFYGGVVGELPKLGDTARLNKKNSKGIF